MRDRFEFKSLIIGCDSQLALSLQAYFRAEGTSFIACTKQEIDITNHITIKRAILKYKPQFIINTAAYTAVDKAESEKKIALSINFDGVQNLAKIAEDFQIPLFHISTDYIFDGLKGSPYLETDPANPINIYGESKYLGEEAIIKNCEQYYILRVSGVFSEYKKNFVKTIFDKNKSSSELRIVNDQWTCPTYTSHIAKVISCMQKKQQWGIYHYCDSPVTTWYDFTKSILTNLRSVVGVKGISTNEYPTAAKRPTYSVLDCQKVAKIFGIQQFSWKTGLENMIES